MPSILREFDNPGAFWGYVSRPVQDQAGAKSQGSECTDGGSTSFYQSRDLPEALRLAREGWPEGLAQIKAMTARLDAKIGRAVGRPEPVHDVIGECADVGAFIAGAPEDMIDFRPADEARIVRLVCNVTTSAFIDTATIMRRGAIACALADAIERAGMRAEIVAAFRSEYFTCTVVIKRADEPLNLDRAVFALAHPSMQRRLMFRMMEHEALADRRALGVENGTYGHVKDLEPAQQGDIYFPGMRLGDLRWIDDASAERAALDMLRAAGVQVEQDARA